MKKTLIITLEFPPQIGGIASYTSQMADTFDSGKIVVLAPSHKDAKNFDKDLKYKVIRKNLFFPKFVWPRWLKLLFHAWRIVKREGIEVILVHHILPVGYVAWLLRFFTKTPYLIFSHGTDLLLSTRNKWKKMMTVLICNEAAQIIFNSDSLQRRFLEILPDFEHKSIILYPCPDDIFFSSPAPEKLDELRAQLALRGKRIMLSVSRLGDGKGFPHLMRLMPKLLEKVPNLVWLVVGDGPKRDMLIKQMQKNNLQNAVRFIGAAQHQDLAGYYHLAELFVLLTHPDVTRGEEGLGLVFLEASAAGLPIVAGKSGGVEEAVLHAQTGLVVDTYQDVQVVGAISQLVENSDYAARLGSAARQRVRADFQWEHQLSRLNPWLE